MHVSEETLEIGIRVLVDSLAIIAIVGFCYYRLRKGKVTTRRLWKAAILSSFTFAPLPFYPAFHSTSQDGTYYFIVLLSFVFLLQISYLSCEIARLQQRELDRQLQDELDSLHQRDIDSHPQRELERLQRRWPDR